MLNANRGDITLTCSAITSIMASLLSSVSMMSTTYRSLWQLPSFNRSIAILALGAFAVACDAVVRRFFSTSSIDRRPCLAAAVVPLFSSFSPPDAELRHYALLRTRTGSSEGNACEPTGRPWLPKLFLFTISLTSLMRELLDRFLRVVKQLLPWIARSGTGEQLHVKRGASQRDDIGCIANIALDYGIDLAFDWSSPLILTPFVEWTEPSIDNALSSVMRLLTLSEVARDEAISCKLVEIQRSLHAAKSSLRLRDRLSPQEKGLFDQRLRERVSRLNVMLRG